MAYEFNMALSSQREWAWLVAIDLFLGGLGGGLFLLFQYFALSHFVALLSLGLVILGGVVLLSELGRPVRAWRALARLRTSWISRGVLLVTCFILSGALYLAPAFPALSWLPWADNNLAAKILWFIAGLCALLITLYPGFVLSASRSIPFWNTPFLPLLFFVQSAMGASGIVLLISPFTAFERGVGQIESLASLLIVVNIVLVAIYLFAMNQSGAAGKESVRLLNQASLGGTFWVGVILVGMIFPLLMVVWLHSAVALAGAFVLIGGLLFRYCLLKAGVYVPPALVGLDMSRLNRNDADLAQEYAGIISRRP